MSGFKIRLERPLAEEVNDDDRKWAAHAKKCGYDSMGVYAGHFTPLDPEWWAATRLMFAKDGPKIELA